MNALNEALEALRGFIATLQDSLNGFPVDRPEVWFGTEEDGAIWLDGDEAQQYREVVGGVIRESTRSEQIGRKAVEKLCQQAILGSLDIRERNDQLSFEERTVNAIKALRKALRAKPVPFEVYLPVCGLDPEGLPVTFGNVAFCMLDDDTISQLPPVRIRNPKDQLSILDFARPITESPVGLVEVHAIEAGAAKDRALKDLRLALDALNFYSDMLPNYDGYLFLPGDSKRERTRSLTLKTEGDLHFSIGAQVVGPLMPLRWPLLAQSNQRYNLGLERAGSLLAKKRNGLEDRVLAAIQWAGRASAEKNRKEQAFLLYAIALESLVLIENETDELGYRLRMRVAHLLGKTVESKRTLVKDLKKLYGIRSKIVHSGSYEVTDLDLFKLRFITKNCILRILKEEPFSSMTSVGQLTGWFDEQMLAGHADSESTRP